MTPPARRTSGESRGAWIEGRAKQLLTEWEPIRPEDREFATAEAHAQAEAETKDT